MKKLLNKTGILIFLIVIAITFLVFLLFTDGVKGRLFPICFMMLSFLVFYIEMFLAEYIEIDVESVFLYSGVVTMNIFYVLLTFIFVILNNYFFTESRYIIINLIMFLLNILGFILIYNSSKKNRGEN